jgi:signal transduction histidine kinase
MFQPRARDRNLSFITDGLDQAPRYLITDELKLRQVLVNLPLSFCVLLRAQ